MKFNVKIIIAPEEGECMVDNIEVSAPSHHVAICEALDQLADAPGAWHEGEMPRSLAYVADRIDPRPEDEPEELFFLRSTPENEWTVIAGEEQRLATPEEADMLADAGKVTGCFSVKNQNWRELPLMPRRR